MPADLEEALNKKGGLTLTQLAIYDDILTDALVDRVYFWANIRKVRPNARPYRGIREEDVCKILQENVIIEKDPIAAQKAMLQQVGFANYMRSLKTEDEKEHFERHLRKYINIYLPDCPFEVCTTHRYTITTAEASVVARKPIKAGEAIRYLSGIQVEMTEEEEAGLSSRTDFSIVLSSRRKRPSLFLGPARFANHDCDSNARLTTTGPHGISIVACKNIAVGDEITVKYGNDYFGEDNCECLCGSCEEQVRNGWDPRGPLLRHDTSDEESGDDDEEAERPSKRQRTTGIFRARQSQGDSSSGTKRMNNAALSPQVSHHPNTTTPRKRGRPRKNPLPVERINETCTTTARELLAMWFEARAQQDPLDPLHLQRDNKSQSSSPLQHIPEQQKHYGKLNHVLELMHKRAKEELHLFEEKLKVIKYRSAEILGVHTSALPGYYAALDRDDHLPVLTVPEVKLDNGIDRTTTQHLTPERSLDGKQYSQSSNPAPSDHVPKHHDKSPLRKVTVPDDLDAVSKPSRMKCRATELSTVPQISTTNSSSRSSIFSHATNAEPISPPSSHDEDVFTSGNICQNIVEMYTRDEDVDVLQDAIEEQIQTEEEASSHRMTRSRRSMPAVNSIEQQSEVENNDEDDSDDDNEEKRGPPRTPSDYSLTPALLIDINDRWVECRNCDEDFVQHDAYQTRIACPRCERHSKLYGYHWPKTDKAGKDDREERVLDHRLIHRFIDPEEERFERKGRKTLAEVLKEREVSMSQEAQSSRSGTRELSRRRSKRLA